MAGKFSGIIGFIDSVETKDGVYDPSSGITEVSVKGELKQHYVRKDTSDINSDLTLNHRIEVIADNPMLKKCMTIRYVKYGYPQIDGVWSVSNIETVEPHLVLTIGGVYNGRTPKTKG